MKINLGCGTDRKDGYINIDIRTDVMADMILDLEKTPYSFDTNSVDEIFAKDILEHFSFRNVEQVIKEWYRILKIGGKLIINTPDFDGIVTCIAEGTINGWKDISYWIFGGQEFKENYHKSIFTQNEIKKYLESIGFRIDNIYTIGSNMNCETTKL